MANPTPGRRPDWVDDELYPFSSQFIEINGNIVHYVDEGDGPVVLMLHGNPTWSFLYREVIAGLKDKFRCIALDYPGFGLSSARSGYGFTYAEHTDLSAAFIEQLDLTAITLFVQDWGGPIGFGAAVRDPGRYRGLVIGNTFAWPATQTSWKAMSKLLGGPVGRWIAGRTNFLAKGVAGMHKRAKLTSAESDHYTAPFPDPASRHPQTTFLRQVTAAQAELTQLETALHTLRDLPTLILWADQDNFYKETEASRIRDIFPEHEVHVLEGVGHFIQDDAGPEIVSTIRAWRPNSA